MPVSVKIPTLWRQDCQGAALVELPAGSLQDVLRALGEHFPHIGAQLWVAHGEVNPGIHVFINQEHMRFRGGLSAPVEDGDEVYIVPMISGGSGWASPRPG